MESDLISNIAIVGEQDTSRAGKVRREINKLIKGVSTNTFNLADLLFEAKAERFFTKWGFETFSKYAKSLDIKYTKSYYLVKIVENMKGAGLTREEYEPTGLGKLRVISRLSLAGEYKGIPMPMVIRELTLKAKNMSLEEVQFEVDTILGMTEDESMVWMNIHLKKLARENVVKPALARAKNHLPQTEDDEGQHKDASDGAALEVICANFLTDPNFADPEETAEIETPSTETDAQADEISDKL